MNDSEKMTFDTSGWYLSHANEFSLLHYKFWRSLSVSFLAPASVVSGLAWRPTGFAVCYAMYNVYLLTTHIIMSS